MTSDYKRLLENYGNEYLSEMNPDDCIYSMDDLNEITNFNALEAITRAFFGYDFNPFTDSRESFNPNREYFAFNGYANLVSIDERDYAAWLNLHIDELPFLDWCEQNGYIE